MSSRSPANHLLPGHLLRELAVASDTHPTTVAKYVLGQRVRPLCAKRIERALRARGLAPLRVPTGQPVAGSEQD